MRLGMQIAFGCVHRKTASTGLGYLGHNSFLKLTPMVRLGNRTYRGRKCLFIFRIHYSFLFCSVMHVASGRVRRKTFSLRPIHAQTNSLCYKGSQCIRNKVDIENEFPNYKTK